MKIIFYLYLKSIVNKLLYLQEDDKELDSTVRENLPMDGWQEV